MIDGYSSFRPLFHNQYYQFMVHKITFLDHFITYLVISTYLLQAMDSGTSGSIQSSSGGDDEYDSRSDSMSTFLTPALISDQQQHPPPPPGLFDPFSNYFNMAFSRSPPPNPLVNLDMIWNRAPTTTTAITATTTPPISASSSSPQTTAGWSTAAEAPAAARNPKKRSRASRRAPTTVLTTDTSNFRAMVQEFTGIPTPPFAAASPFALSHRLDLFGSSAGAATAPHYLLRPFAHKLQPSSTSSLFPSPVPSMLDMLSSPTLLPPTIASNLPIPLRIGATAASSQTINSISKHDPTQMMGINSSAQQLFSFQPLLQPSPTMEKPLGRSTAVSSSVIDLGLIKTGSLVDDLASAPLTRPEEDDHGGKYWSERAGVANGEEGSNTRSTYHGSSSCKMNFSASSSHFHAEKGPENVSSRGEGMVDSWICSSDQ